MNIGNVGATTYNTWTNRTDGAKKRGNSNFSNVIGNQGAATHLTIHGLKGEIDAEGKTVVGAWGNAITGTSTTVYKPKDFDENDPVYQMKIWDAEGNVTEREVHLNEVNPANSDSFEMYAYSCYLSDSGKRPGAMLDFMSSHAYYQGEEGYGANSYEDMSAKVNWFEIIKGLMDMQYQLNNLEGYLKYKGFYDVLMEETTKDTSRPFTVNGKTFHFDSDEQIRLGGGQKANSDYQINNMSSGTEPVYAKQTGAVSVAETEDEGEFLGLTMVPEEGQSVTYGMRAMLSEKSTPDNPIVQVVSNLGGKKVIYNVEVNKINPNNATQLEMFALLSYTDKMGITDGGTFGSHQQLEVYGGNASSIGYCNSFSGANAFLNARFDWEDIMKKMVQVYLDAGIDKQAEDCKALADFFGTYTENSKREAEIGIDFSKFAPNAPDEVKQAFMEAAEETGYYEYSGNAKMNHISQLLVRQMENRQNGVANYTDVFGGTIASALQAAREILYDLENPLMPISLRGENAAKYTEQEKEFYISLIDKLEALQETTGRNNTAENATEDTAENLDYAQAIRAKIEEIYEKVSSGDTEQSFAIGSQSFTLEEWDEFLAKFDAAEEEIQKMQREEIEKRTEQNMDMAAKSATEESAILTSESTMCTYPASNSDEEDIRYITWYTEEGIFCRKAGQTEGYEWTVPFENKEQYEKVMDLLNRLPSDYNSRFAAHENFWTDYLNGEIDGEAFLNFMEGTDKGIPNYATIRGNSVFVDIEKMKWAPYLNPLGAKFYTAEEFQRMQMEIVEANAAKLPKITDSFEGQYKKSHSEYNGERIFRFENNSKLYNLDEIPILMYQKLLQESGYSTEQ